MIKWQTEKKPSSHSITDVFLTAFHSIPSSDSASEAPLYPESDHEAADPKASLRSAAQHNTQTQNHEYFLVPTKRRVCGPLGFIVPRLFLFLFFFSFSFVLLFYFILLCII